MVCWFVEGTFAGQWITTPTSLLSFDNKDFQPPLFSLSKPNS